MASKEIAEGACGAGPAYMHALRRSPIVAGAGALAMAVEDDVWGLGVWREWMFRAWQKTSPGMHEAWDPA
ncbi:hypothetical protein [Pontibacter sp. G13]|uniref:hypothetical protein n=1 Tax=Pontibacter sp. G13 TaxID=3074898 RepID=UPI00288A3CA1|nr:hypothetical protein [Pontibacter sp. G13]WNJ20004.1 hypothetical protein RJD25_05930 [Pontibacter sp. G13]